MLVKISFKLLESLLALTFLCFFGLIHGKAAVQTYDEKNAKIYLEKANIEIQEKMTESSLASWAYESNITDENLRNQLEVSAKVANFSKNLWLETIKFPWKTFKDPDIKRRFKKMSILGTAALPPEKYKEYQEVVNKMQSTYGKGRVCDYKNKTNCDLQIEPEITEIFAKSRDPDELSYYWEQWRNTVGKPIRKPFKRYVELSNESARLNNFTDTSESWLNDYEAPDFRDQIEGLWMQVKPLYLQLHAYIRKRLRDFYGEERITKTGPIPAHLLGNMWGQSWGNIYDLAVPYPGKQNLDVTATMIEQGYTPLRMFKLAEEFFTSLNLSPMPESFWKNSIIEKPNDGRDLICHASAWDFYDGKDFRIKQCTRVTFKQLVTVHHEMGHIQYYIQYKNQPKVYKRGANPGFHEAVGDVMALSVSTPKHLRRIGLLNVTEDDEESEINQLFKVALDKIAFLPFGYLMDQWRWGVFQGTTTEQDYNEKWWQLRENYQGLSPSVVRTEEDFDPGAKYHTAGVVPYIRYFVSFIIQFQFHRSLCIAAKEYDPLNPQLKPLHKCDIYQSKEAGALLKKMLEMGSSKPWPEAMEVITGKKVMDAQPLLDYFAILKDWLEKENAKTGEYIGWETSPKACQQGKSNGDDDFPSDKKGKYKFAVVPIQKNKAKFFTGLRNIEDDNSYAEFVQQDDNSFGIPEYIEETKPSYHVLRHTSKQGYEGKVVPIPCEQKLKCRTEKVKCQSEGNSCDKSKNKKCKASVCEIRLLQKRPTCERKKPTPELPKTSCPTVESLKHQYNQPFKIRSKSDDQQRVKILNVILSDGHPLKTFKQAKLIEDDAKCAMAGPVLIKRTSKNNENTIQKKKEDNIVALDKEKAEDSGKLEDKEHENDIKKENENTNPDKLNVNLLMQAEMVKNKAQQMLKNFNFSSYAKKYMDVDQLRDIQRKDFPQLVSKTVENFQPEPIESQNIFSLKENLHQKEYDKIECANLRKNSKAAARKGESNAEVHFAKHDLLKMKPIESAMKKKRKTQKNSSGKNSFVILIEKISDDSKNSEKVKKSYKEYHYSVRTPVIYNSVIISNSGKFEKSNDARYRRAEHPKLCKRYHLKNKKRKIGRRRKRKKPNIGSKDNMAIFVLKLSKPVRKKKQININNILQYFGLTTPFVENVYFF